MSTVGSLAGVFLLGVGIVAGAYGLRRRRQRDAIAGVETTDVLRLTPGPAEVYGTAEPTEDGPLPTPFSDDDCLLVEWEIEEWEESGKHSSWRTEGAGTITAPFYVDDGTDRVLVRPGEATVELSGPRETTEVGVDEPLPGPIQRFVDLDSTPGEPRGAFLQAIDWGTRVGDRKYHQRVLRPGDQVYVHGTATRVGAETFGANDFEIVARADDGHPDAELFLVADRPESELLADRGDAVIYLTIAGFSLLAGAGLLVASLLAG
ncbi:hypothetical protein HWV07_02385 [Natronomonas salina]|uniref:GIDE domain-containing protein n=1 Tax=Natronomonas salina TaxID=1710540 RepID=UPI0015B627BD|nr:GIDE domain-containing protein [Natronomonas salina]QLD87946.1 hypothetical protein HWV07_02385 [Natronomonas salina]